MAIVSYFLDGVNLREYGIFVSKSHGLLDRPAIKEKSKVDWPDQHGLMWNHNNKRLQPREIELSCFVRATSKYNFVLALSKFFRLFDQDGPRQLIVEAGTPLVYMVECEEKISVDKVWSNSEMVGTFTLRLTESLPVKRLFAFRPNSDTACSMTILSNEPLTIFWGDGTSSYDVMSNGVKSSDRTYDGDAVVLKHKYSERFWNRGLFVVIAGNIDALAINDTKTNAQLIWDRY